MRLSDAGMRCRQSKMLYPNHRPSLAHRRRYPAIARTDGEAQVHLNRMVSNIARASLQLSSVAHDASMVSRFPRLPVLSKWTAVNLLTRNGLFTSICLQALRRAGRPPMSEFE